MKVLHVAGGVPLVKTGGWPMSSPPACALAQQGAGCVAAARAARVIEG
jgi:hypothetical protein